MRQRRDAEGDGDSSPLPAPLRAAEKDERRRNGRGDRERERMRQPAMRDGPSEEIDVGEDGAPRGDETHAPSGRALLRPRSDRESDGGMRDRCGHQS